MSMEQFKRATAYKLKISDITSADYIKQDPPLPNYIIHNGEHITRVNLIANVINLENQESQDTLTLDDGSSTIGIRFFENRELLKNIAIGDTVLIIGKPRIFGEEKYILPEAIKKMSLDWLKVRNLELPTNTPVKAEEISEPIIKDKKELIFEEIKNRDSGQGVPIEEIIKQYPDADKFVKDLLHEGDIFELKPGIVKALE